MKNRRRSSLVVSVASFPDRIVSLRLMLKSLMLQSVLPNRIEIVIWHAHYDAMHPELSDLIDRSDGLISVRCVDTDLRSYKKFVPYSSLEAGQDMVTVDDDVVYSPGFLKALLHESQRYPRSIVGTRGYKMVRANDGSMAPYRRWIYLRGRLSGTDVLLTGVGGVLYPRGVVSCGLLCDWKLAVELCPDADDLWARYSSTIAGASVVCLGKRYFEMVPGSQGVGLWHGNTEGSGNDESIARLIRYDPHFSDF